MLPDTAAIAALLQQPQHARLVGRCKKMMIYATSASVAAGIETRRHLPRAEPLLPSAVQLHLVC